MMAANIPSSMLLLALLVPLLSLVASFGPNKAAWTIHSQRNTSTRRFADCGVEAAADTASTPGSTSTLTVALTREVGKNTKLQKTIESSERLQQLFATGNDSEPSIQTLELPCIAHAAGPDTDKLPSTLSSKQFDYIAITSPEAAKVFASAWKEAGQPQLGVVAAVGKATKEALSSLGIDVGFVPSKATAATLVQELPFSQNSQDEGRSTTLLYPASAKAANTLQDGLEGRGFKVDRLNTYDTVTATWTGAEKAAAISASRGVLCESVGREGLASE
ncbi:hypothetical protein THAOC_20998 [Thalassiosira oceanica]|uniref:Uroporphyrinogen-III synthase n=1 Tax=Thalassiosira oceanica TaxID=159749 RepID=K0RYI2_THAOC|nr:hypothetical protein THAOC_20998 [Thalassiosira oceanica]|eukprot:EJK58843.1 hypothetical protein THAOC_20998 [Thalassiosira oceanica]